MLFNIVFVWLVVSVVADYRGWKPEEWGQYWVSPNPVRCRDDGAPFMALRTTICPEGRTLEGGDHRYVIDMCCFPNQCQNRFLASRCAI